MKIDANSRFRKFADALENIDVKKLMLQSAKETSELALDLNKVQLRELSIDSDGKPLGKYRSGKRKGLPYTLYATGDWQDKMFLNTQDVPIFIGSKDAKAPILEGKFPKALGLTKEFGEQYKDEVREVYNVKIKRVIENAKKILQ